MTVPGSITGVWATRPTRRRSSGGASALVSWPPSRTVPPSIGTSRTSARSSVDFPEPDGASSAVTAPPRHVDRDAVQDGPVAEHDDELFYMEGHRPPVSTNGESELWNGRVLQVAGPTCADPRLP